MNISPYYDFVLNACDFKMWVIKRQGQERFQESCRNIGKKIFWRISDIHTYDRSTPQGKLCCSMLGRSSTSIYVGMGDFFYFEVSKLVKSLLSLPLNNKQ